MHSIQTGAGTVRPGSPTLDDLVVRVPWFSKAQWTDLAAAAGDFLCSEAGYAQWRKDARENIASIHRAGIRTRKVDVNTSAFIIWCRERSKEVNSAALAEYIAICPVGE